MKPRPWDRELWGVAFETRAQADRCPLLLGDTWINPNFSQRYIGEPTHVMLFRTREQARAQARKMTEQSKAHSTGWRFWAVRVREVVSVIS